MRGRRRVRSRRSSTISWPLRRQGTPRDTPVAEFPPMRRLAWSSIDEYRRQQHEAVARGAPHARVAQPRRRARQADLVECAARTGIGQGADHPAEDEQLAVVSGERWLAGPAATPSPQSPGEAVAPGAAASEARRRQLPGGHGRGDGPAPVHPVPPSTAAAPGDWTTAPAPAEPGRALVVNGRQSTTTWSRSGRPRRRRARSPLPTGASERTFHVAGGGEEPELTLGAGRPPRR